MKATLFTTSLLSLLTTISASAPLCAQQGHSLELANGTFPYHVFTWGNIASLSTCQSLCLAKDGCYSYAHSVANSQCHGYDEIVPLISFTANSSAEYFFYDLCCTV